MAERVDGFRTPARIFHWATVVFVLLMIPAGLVMVQDGLDRTVQNALFIFHKNVGVVVLLLVLARLAYRLAVPPPPLPDSMPAWQHRVSGITHGLLYALLIAMPIAGYVRVRAGGFPIEALDALGIPTLVPRSESLAEFAKMLHWLGGFALAALIALHVAAALFHAIVKQDGVFSRIWPLKSPN
jgi:cytochrome b561